MGQRELNHLAKPYLAAVLVCDRSIDVRALASIILGKRGFDVEHAATPVEALEKLEGRRFSAILVEGGSSPDEMSAFSELAASRPELSVSMIVMMSVSLSPGRHDSLTNMSIGGIITKPFDVRELVEVVVHCATLSDSPSDEVRSFRPAHPPS